MYTQCTCSACTVYATYLHCCTAFINHRESEIVDFGITDRLKILQRLVNDKSKLLSKPFLLPILFLLNHFKEGLVVPGERREGEGHRRREEGQRDGERRKREREEEEGRRTEGWREEGEGHRRRGGQWDGERREGEGRRRRGEGQRDGGGGGGGGGKEFERRREE